MRSDQLIGGQIEYVKYAQRTGNKSPHVLCNDIPDVRHGHSRTEVPSKFKQSQHFVGAGRNLIKPWALRGCVDSWHCPVRQCSERRDCGDGVFRWTDLGVYLDKRVDDYWVIHPASSF